MWDCDGDARHAVRLLGVVPVPLLVGRWCLLSVCWGVGVVFGNCIVDASILACLHVLCGCVVFLFCRCFRAFGGCLGMKGRRRTLQPAICLGELASEC